MKKFVNNWFYISVFFSGIAAVCAILIPLSEVQRLLLLSVSILFLHFFEEFGFPGGFPYMGIKVLMKSKEKDPTKWDCNNLSSMFGNWVFLAAVYLLPVFLHDIRFMVLAVFMFNFAELFMHLILFNVALKTWYNSGLITATTGLAPISFYFFFVVFHASDYMWYDYMCAFFYFAFFFWFCFRSPLYWKLGKKPGYEFTEQSAFGPFKN